MKLYTTKNNVLFLPPLQLPQIVVILTNDNCTPKSDVNRFTTTAAGTTAARWRTTVVRRRVELCPRNAQAGIVRAIIFIWRRGLFCRARVCETEKQMLFQWERLRAERASVRRRLGVGPVCDQLRLRTGNDRKVWLVTHFLDLPTEKWLYSLSTCVFRQHIANWVYPIR